MRFVRYTGPPSPGASDSEAPVRTQPAVVLDPWSAEDGNIAWRFKINGRVATVPLRAHERDLFDLAAMVYIADELVPRKAGADFWTREMEFALPVCDRDSWKRVEPDLVHCLSFLSGDTYRFEWTDGISSLPKRVNHRLRLHAANHSAVCLFSGGVDSLLGAVDLLTSGKRLLLVGHYADRVTSSAQQELFSLLRRKFPDQVSLLQVYVKQSQKRRRRHPLPHKVEISHRTRSFLFLAAGVVAANATGVESLFIPENGLIALNSPLGSSRRGTLSTRTTHPRFLDLVQGVFKELGFGVTIKNQFVFQSKTDMLQAVTDPDIRSALLRSVSCAHAGNLRWAGRGYTHCGYCVPCLYRRAAFLDAGLEETGYQHDVFRDLPTLSPGKARDFRMLAKFARAIEQAGEMQQVAAVLRHGGFSSGQEGDDYARRAAMLKRWALSFLRLVRQCAAPDTRRILGL